MNNWQKASLGMLICAGVGCKMSGSSGDYIKKYTQSPELVSVKTKMNASMQSSTLQLKAWKDSARSFYNSKKAKLKDSTGTLQVNLTKVNSNNGGAPCIISDGDYTTYTIHSFGIGKKKGPGMVQLSQNWEQIGSISIGCGSKIKTFTTAAQVGGYLPTGSNKNGNIAPFTDEVEVKLATQILALSASIALDNNLSCLKLQSLSGDLVGFNDMSVADILYLSNEILGGCNGGYEMATLTRVIEAINMNFENGKLNKGLLTCGHCL
ncbi:MAG: hypothetical protein RL642_617 [Bacteroidota bacterium]